KSKIFSAHTVISTATYAKSQTVPAKRKPRSVSRETSKPTGVGDILASMKKSTALGKRLKEAQIWQQWPGLAGKRLCTHGHPVVVKDKTLHVEAYSPVWVSKFAYHKWEIIGRVNRMAGQELISDIFVTLAEDEETK
ncbi:MAG: DUF721 domain-containing protein, partial [Candidatus Hydrogenedentes bacterium]|nr:DUF721 domain-containing protein [Candidatus Hydrogenedentota bacterium]